MRRTFLLGASRHDRAALLRAEVRDGSIEHVDLVEEVNSWKAQKPPVSTLQHKIPTAQAVKHSFWNGFWEKTLLLRFFLRSIIKEMQNATTDFLE